MEARKSFTMWFPRLEPEKNNLLNELIFCLLRREPFQAGDILANNPELLTAEPLNAFEDGFFNEDDKKRKFSLFSPVQYAGWALDTPMLYWLVLHWALTFTPSTHLHKKETLVWMKSVRSQAENGVRYRLEELKEFLDKMLASVPVDKKSMLAMHLGELKSHYDMQTLIAPLKSCLENFDSWSIDRKVAGWSMVGNAQCQTTWRVVHEYCSNVENSYFGDVEHDTLPRSDELLLKVNNKIVKNESGWGDLLKERSLSTRGVISYENKAYSWNPKEAHFQHIRAVLNENVNYLETSAKRSVAEFRALLTQLGPAVEMKKDTPKLKK